ncbi:substrate-binding periplasmic protein [Pseudomonas sp. zbq_18]|uniref:substrate-binding periplasmic protein n=1 Tax=Pseudomonadota TaxID=1224 RepID=UPI00370AF4B0
MRSGVQSNYGWFCLQLFRFALLSVSTWASAVACELKVAVERQAYMPYYSIESGQYVGYARELLDAFAQSIDCHFVYQALPVKRADDSFLGGQLDFRFPDNPEWNTELKSSFPVYYSDPVIDFIDGMLVLPQHLGRGVGGVHELGTLLGFTPAHYEQDIKNGTIVLRQLQNTEALLQMGLKGRVDAIYMNPVVARAALKQKPDALRFDPELPHLAGYYYLSSLKHPELLERFNVFLRDSDELQQSLRKKYGL